MKHDGRYRVKAQEEIYNYILVKSLMHCSLENAVKYIADKNEISFSDLYELAIQQQQQIVQSVGEARKENTKEVVEAAEDLKNYRTAINTKTNLYRRTDSIRRIKDTALLVKLYPKLKNAYLKKELVKNCDLDEIFDMALKDEDESVKIEAIKSIHNRMKLRWAAESCDSKAVKIEAIKKINDPHTLQKIILHDGNVEIKKAALNQIGSISVLQAIASTIPTKYSEYVAERINTLSGTDDYVKMSIENLIQTYH